MIDIPVNRRHLAFWERLFWLFRVESEYKALHPLYQDREFSGSSLAEAVGKLVTEYPEYFDLVITIKSRSFQKD